MSRLTSRYSNSFKSFSMFLFTIIIITIVKYSLWVQGAEINCHLTHQIKIGTVRETWYRNTSLISCEKENTNSCVYQTSKGINHNHTSNYKVTLVCTCCKHMQWCLGSWNSRNLLFPQLMSRISKECDLYWAI